MLTAIEMVAEMIGEADGEDIDELWRLAIADLDRDRGEFEADVLAHHGHVEVEHEWGAFLAYVEELRGR